jgi:hypothetical protein
VFKTSLYQGVLVLYQSWLTTLQFCTSHVPQYHSFVPVVSHNIIVLQRGAQPLSDLEPLGAKTTRCARFSRKGTPTTRASGDTSTCPQAAERLKYATFYNELVPGLYHEFLKRVLDTPGSGAGTAAATRAPTESGRFNL